MVNESRTATGQFLSVDPDVAQTGQPYAYTGDDPVNWIDPLGLSWYDPSWAHKAVDRLERGADKVGHFVTTHKKLTENVGLFAASLLLEETGIGEAIDASIFGEAAGDGAADA